MIDILFTIPNLLSQSQIDYSNAQNSTLWEIHTLRVSFILLEMKIYCKYKVEFLIL